MDLLGFITADNILGFIVGLIIGLTSGFTLSKMFLTSYEERFRVCHINPKSYDYRMTFKNGKYHKLTCQNLAKNKKTCIILQKSCPIAVS